MSRFLLGRCVATPGALAALEANGDSPLVYLARHQAGDYGELSANDRRANGSRDPSRSGARAARILSAYRLADGTKIWIITEADRASTCVLLPSEY